MRVVQTIVPFLLPKACAPAELAGALLGEGSPSWTLTWILIGLAALLAAALGVGITLLVKSHRQRRRQASLDTEGPAPDPSGEDSAPSAADDSPATAAKPAKRRASKPAKLPRARRQAQPPKPALKPNTGSPSPLPPPPAETESLAAASLPLVGKLQALGARQSQQDCFSVSPPELYPTHGLLAVVADGMGGLEAGDQVSQAAVGAMMNTYFTLHGDEPPQQRLLFLLQAANGAVNHMLGPERIGQSGSTLAAGLLLDHRFYFVSVGDSRICLYRDGALYQLNREHVYRHELELRAVNGEGSLEAASTHPRASGLTSYLGMGQLRWIDQSEQPVLARPGDRFLLMSDGVYNALSEQELCHALALEAPKAAKALGQMVSAKAWPGQDNYTAVILQC